MEFLVGWGLILLVAGALAFVIRISGPAEKTRPNCGGDTTSGDSRRGCH